MDRRQILNNSDARVDIDKPVFATPAVSVKNGYKAYAKGNPILNDFNMTVPRGTMWVEVKELNLAKIVLHD